MSGPKSANYYLTQKQREILEQNRKISEILSSISKSSSRFFCSETMLERFRKNAEMLLQESESENGFFQLEKELLEIRRNAEELIKGAGLHEFYENLLERYSKIQNCAELFRNKISDMYSADSLNRQELESIYSKKLGSFSEIDFNVKSRSEKVRIRLDGLLSLNLSESLEKEVSDTIEILGRLSDEQEVKNFTALTVVPLERKCIDYTEIIDDYMKILAEYHAVCEYAETEPVGYDVSRESIDEMKSEIQRIRNISAESDEKSYIRNAVDQTMSEMGYSLIGKRNVQKKNGTKFRSELYTFSEGTAVNITCSSRGEITMEIGGIDYSDRIPDESEKEMLCGEMENFCSKFSEFEKRLAEKGVISRHISILPPDSDYAQIINLNDYETISGTPFSDIGKFRKNTRKEHLKSEFE